MELPSPKVIGCGHPHLLHQNGQWLLLLTFVRYSGGTVSSSDVLQSPLIIGVAGCPGSSPQQVLPSYLSPCGSIDSQISLLLRARLPKVDPVSKLSEDQIRSLKDHRPDLDLARDPLPSVYPSSMPQHHP